MFIKAASLASMKASADRKKHTRVTTFHCESHGWGLVNVLKKSTKILLLGPHSNNKQASV